MRRSGTDRLLVTLLVLAVGLAACTAAPGVVDEPSPTPAQPTPTTEPSPSPTAEPMPTEAATAAPAASPTATPPPQAPDDPYEPGGGGSATPAAGGEATVNLADNAEHGQILVGPQGLTLYIFTRDRPGVSNCIDSCLDAWPPLTLAMGEMPTAGSGVSGTLATIARDDGSYQVTYDDQPLYHFSGDTAPGETNGQGVGGYWFVIEP